MPPTYGALRAIAMITRIVTFLVVLLLAIGIVTGVASAPSMGGTYLFAGIVLMAVTMLLGLASAESLDLFCNIATDVRRIADAQAPLAEESPSPSSWPPVADPPLSAQPQA